MAKNCWQPCNLKSMINVRTRGCVERRRLSVVHCEGESVCVCVSERAEGGNEIIPSVEWETGTTPLAPSFAQTLSSSATFQLGVVLAFYAIVA
jgi:hypothetical protein